MSLSTSRPAAVMMLTGAPEHVARQIALESIASIPGLLTPAQLTARFWETVTRLPE